MLHDATEVPAIAVHTIEYRIALPDEVRTAVRECAFSLNDLVKEIVTTSADFLFICQGTGWCFIDLENASGRLSIGAAVQRYEFDGVVNIDVHKLERAMTIDPAELPEWLREGTDGGEAQ